MRRPPSVLTISFFSPPCPPHRPRAQTFTTIDVPGATLTQPFSISNSGDIVGGYPTPPASARFLLSRGTITTIDFPARRSAS
jgi:hypothetical protein